MRFLQQHTRPVARLLFCTAGAAMIEIAQNPQSIFDQPMCLVGVQVDEDPDTARAADRPWAEQAKICFHHRGRCLEYRGTESGSTAACAPWRAQILNRPLLAGHSSRTVPLTLIAHRRLGAFRILLAFGVPEFA